MTIWRMRIACWLPKATNKHHPPTGCVILTAFPLQQWLHERASLLRYICTPVLLVHGSTALVDLGLLIFVASSSHAGVDYTWLLYTPVASEFITHFKIASSNYESDSARWRLNP
jgi:hypothetical protein